MKSNLRRASILLLLILLFLSGQIRTIAQQYELCPKAYIVGREQQNHNAHSYLGGGTTDISQVEFYVTSVDSKLYLQSNYQPEGADYPIKLSADALSRDLKTWVKTLVSFGGRLSMPKNFTSAYEREVTFYIDEALFSDPKYHDFSLGRLSKAYVVDNQGGKWPAHFEQQVFAELAPQIFLKLPSVDDIAGVEATLKSSLINKQKIKLLPLIIDEPTIEAARQKLPGDNLLIMDSFSTDSLRQQLSQHRGETIFVLGHYDSAGDRLLVSDAYGKPVFNVTLEQLKSMGKELGIKIFPLGCETAKVSSTEGTLHPFNSVDAVNRFHQALTGGNWAEFLQALAKDDLGIVITKSFVEGEATVIEANIVMRTRFSRIIGSVTFEVTSTAMSQTPGAATSPGPSLSGNGNNGDSGTETSGTDTSSRLLLVVIVGVVAVGVVFGVIRLRSQS